MTNAGGKKIPDEQTLNQQINIHAKSKNPDRWKSGTTALFTQQNYLQTHWYYSRLVETNEICPNRGSLNLNIPKYIRKTNKPAMQFLMILSNLALIQTSPCSNRQYKNLTIIWSPYPKATELKVGANGAVQMLNDLDGYSANLFAEFVKDYRSESRCNTWTPFLI